MTTATILDHDLRSPHFAYNRHYVDTGCSLAPKCLSCPFPRCRYDVQRSARRLSMSDRNADIRARLRAAIPAAQLAAEYGITIRQVYRLKAGV